MNDWKKHKLGDVADVQTGPFGSQLHKHDYVEIGTPIITVEHLGENRIIHSNLPLVSDSDKNRLSKYVLKQGDIVFSRVGSVDRRAFVHSTEDGWMFSGRCLRVRVNKSILNPYFLSCFFGQESFKEYIRRIAVGATMPSINTSILSNIEVPVPPLDKQNAISEILSSLDEKIELNKQTNKTLEEIANTLYKNWFVDFSPLKGNKFVESELGLIPEGWEIKKVNQLFDLTIGRTPPRKEQEWFSKNPNDIKWISIRDMGNADMYIYSTSEYLTREALDKHNIPKIPSNTVVLSFKLTVGRITITTEEMLSNEAIAHFIPMNNNYLTTSFIYLFLRNYDYNSLGSTSSIATAVNTQTIKNINVLYPDKKTIDSFDLITKNLFEQIRHISLETETLIQMRNYLLPKLISGEIDVKQAIKKVKEIL